MVLNNNSSLRFIDRSIHICESRDIAGRISLELLRNCINLDIDHADASRDHFNVLSSLLDRSSLEWNQPLEGRIVERRKYELGANAKTLLQDKGNNISFKQSTIGKAIHILCLCCYSKDCLF